MKKIILCVLLATATQIIAMHQEHGLDTHGKESPEITYYKTFLFYTWGPQLYEFHEKNPENEHAKKLERFKNNYLFGAILYKYLKKCSEHDAARISYRNTPSGACALHTILHGPLDYFNEDDYANTDYLSRWRNELDYIDNYCTQQNSN